MLLELDFWHEKSAFSEIKTFWERLYFAYACFAIFVSPYILFSFVINPNSLTI